MVVKYQDRKEIYVDADISGGQVLSKLVFPVRLPLVVGEAVLTEGTINCTGFSLLAAITGSALILECYTVFRRQMKGKINNIFDYGWTLTMGGFGHHTVLTGEAQPTKRMRSPGLKCIDQIFSCVD